MLLTPNKLNYGTCPHCKCELNTWSYVPANAIGNKYFVSTVCPNIKCKKDIHVRVYVTFDVEVESN